MSASAALQPLTTSGTPSTPVCHSVYGRQLTALRSFRLMMSQIASKPPGC